jgi:hypothetical protein
MHSTTTFIAVYGATGQPADLSSRKRSAAGCGGAEDCGTALLARPLAAVSSILGTMAPTCARICSGDRCSQQGRDERVTVSVVALYPPRSKWQPSPAAATREPSLARTLLKQQNVQLWIVGADHP